MTTEAKLRKRIGGEEGTMVGAGEDGKMIGGGQRRRLIGAAMPRNAMVADT
jgi:hypothetical protein